MVMLAYGKTGHRIGDWEEKRRVKSLENEIGKQISEVTGTGNTDSNSNLGGEKRLGKECEIQRRRLNRRLKSGESIQIKKRHGYGDWKKRRVKSRKWRS